MTSRMSLHRARDDDEAATRGRLDREVVRPSGRKMPKGDADRLLDDPGQFDRKAKERMPDERTTK